MNINEHDKKEIKGCMKLLETIKDTSRDYIGTNGCLYQDITREELNLIVNEIERLNNIIDKAIESLNYYIDGMNESLEIWNIVKENEKIEVDMVFQMLEREKQNYIGLLDILKGSDKE